MAACVLEPDAAITSNKNAPSVNVDDSFMVSSLLTNLLLGRKHCAHGCLY